MTCPMCGCEESSWAGRLGNLVHACCRACGWVYEREWDED